MHTENIELELRAEITPSQYKYLEKRMMSIGKFSSRTKRLSVMFFGEIFGRQVDIRVRTTNGSSEIVLKSGAFGAHDRTESSQPIKNEQFLGMVKLFFELRFKAEVGERETINFTVGNDITVSLVLAKTIAYVELECMSSMKNVEKNKERLGELSKMLGLKLLKTENAFNKLCNKLSRTVDWKFLGTKNDMKRISSLIKKHV